MYDVLGTLTIGVEYTSVSDCVEYRCGQLLVVVGGWLAVGFGVIKTVGCGGSVALVVVVVVVVAVNAATVVDGVVDGVFLVAAELAIVLTVVGWLAAASEWCTYDVDGAFVEAAASGAEPYWMIGRDCTMCS